MHYIIVSNFSIIMQVDSYSAFYDNGGFTMTEMDTKLKALGVDTVYVAGLAWDFCVSFTAIDARKLGYESYVITDATRAITPEGMENAKINLAQNHVKLVDSSNLNLTWTSVPKNDEL